ncbi:MAG: MFS transporter, partial [Verrucomicrobiota bacterium]
FYAPRIFQFACFSSTSEQLWGTIFIGIANMFSTLIALFFIDKLGRKPIMTLGFTIMGIALATVGFLLKMDLLHNPVLANIAAGALLLFVFGFGMSAGPVVWLLCSEIFPLAGKDFGVTFSTAANWISNAIVSGSFLTLLHYLGSANTFLLYAGFQAFSWLFFVFFVPETKGVSLEKIESNLFSGLPLRKIGS